jgi:hypothetical protein
VTSLSDEVEGSFEDVMKSMHVTTLHTLHSPSLLVEPPTPSSLRMELGAVASKWAEAHKETMHLLQPSDYQARIQNMENALLLARPAVLTSLHELRHVLERLSKLQIILVDERKVGRAHYIHQHLFAVTEPMCSYYIFCQIRNLQNGNQSQSMRTNCYP